MSQKRELLSKEKLTKIDGKWGETPQDHFGYKDDAERRSKRGMEDWELVNTIPVAQKGVPKWFIGVVLVVVLVAVGLSFPFWGLRPGVEKDWKDWFDWGFVVALVYIAVMSTFVYFMVRFSTEKAPDEAELKQEGDKSSDRGEKETIDGSKEG